MLPGRAGDCSPEAESYLPPGRSFKDPCTPRVLTPEDPQGVREHTLLGTLLGSVSVPPRDRRN